MNPLIVDIETVPLLASLDAPYPEAERNPPGNYKSEEAIAKWRVTDKEQWASGRAKECSLNPRLGRVLCVGLQSSPETWMVPYATEEAHEAHILNSFWDSANSAGGLVVTWNGSWDLRFLVVRSLAHGIVPTLPSAVVRDWFRRYVTRPHFDCKSVLLNGEVKVAGEGLDEWAKFFGIEGKSGGMTGADVWPAFQRGEHERITDYCLQDVRATAAIYERIAPIFA